MPRSCEGRRRKPRHRTSPPRPIWTLPPLKVLYSDSFELQFAALSFAAPSKNRYAYKLEGFDNEFIETTRPYATYTHLTGGDYVLRVRASNQHGDPVLRVQRPT